MAYINNQRSKIGDKNFKQIALISKSNRQKLTDFTEDQLLDYIIQQDMNNYKMLEENNLLTDFNIETYQKLQQNAQLHQNQVNNIDNQQKSPVSSQKSQNKLQRAIISQQTNNTALQNQQQPEQLIIESPIQKTDTESLEAKLAQSHTQMENDREQQIKQQEIIQKQNQIIQEHEEMFQKLKRVFLPQLEIATGEQQLVGQWTLVEYLTSTKRQLSHQNVKSIQEDIALLAKSLQTLKQQLTQQQQQIHEPSHTFQQLARKVETVFYKISQRIEYQSDLAFVGSEQVRKSSPELTKIQLHFQQINKQDLVSQNATPNKELFKFLVEQYIEGFAQPLLLKYFNQNQGEFIDKLSKNQTVENKNACVYLKVHKSEIRRFITFLDQRLEDGDCVQFGDNKAIILHQGFNIIDVCKNYQLIGPKIRIFVGNIDDLRVIEANE